MVDYYKILGVAPNADEETIQKAYRKHALAMRLDSKTNSKEKEAQFRKISEAYRVLSDPEARRKYNADFKSESEQTPTLEQSPITSPTLPSYSPESEQSPRMSPTAPANSPEPEQSPIMSPTLPGYSPVSEQTPITFFGNSPESDRTRIPTTSPAFPGNRLQSNLTTSSRAAATAAHFPRDADMEGYDHLFKLVLIGAHDLKSSGESSLKSRVLLSATENPFSIDMKSTIGVEFKNITYSSDGQAIKLQIWDTAGQERFRTITAGTYRGAHAIIAVLDLCDREAYDQTVRLLESVQADKNGVLDLNVKFYLLAVHTDPQPRVITDEDLEKLSKKTNCSFKIIQDPSRHANEYRAYFEKIGCEIKNEMTRPAEPEAASSSASTSESSDDRSTGVIETFKRLFKK